MMFSRITRLNHIALLATLALLSGCSTTRSATIENRSGFLAGYYDKLGPGDDDQAQLVYMNRSAASGAYKKVLLAPVKVLRTQNAEHLNKYTTEELQEIANSATKIFFEEFSKHFTMTNTRGAETLIIELAITDADKSEPFMDTVTSILPYGLAGSVVKSSITGKPSFVGEASGEGKISDAITGEVLYAGMDRRVGGKMINDPLNSWNDFESVVQFWAERLSKNLCRRGTMYPCK